MSLHGTSTVAASYAGLSSLVDLEENGGDGNFVNSNIYTGSPPHFGLDFAST
jgi:hypothetical protein